ncbi:MAG: DNA translocase FtsK 4TM domain-containing protein, partial [Chitinophagaceae bacterium]|nr:DNA translocase FtsK 4TM domain-containing protein [Chitinophagaceae bacterium]
MAKSTKNNTKKKAEKKETPVINMGTKKQWRLGGGIFLLLTGLFICFSIVSYCFTWKADQDKMLSGSDWYTFLFKDKEIVANWGGRLGAAVSHIMVYEWVGIAAFALGLWISIVGLNFVYGKKVLPIARYLRWMMILVLVVAPILTYALPDATFPYGGAWGNEAIAYMNGLFGHSGTGLILFAVVCFFLFVVFALDISPLLRRARRTAQKMADVAAA